MPKPNEVELTSDIADLFGITRQPGYLTPFTRSQAEGAWPNGSRVAKIAEDVIGDVSPLGSVGTVLGSISHPMLGRAYFVEWDHRPKLAVLAIEWKLERRDAV